MNNSLSSTAVSDRSHDSNRIRASRRNLQTVPHVVGLLSLIWSLIAWAEWFLVPVFYPRDGSPVPYLGFAPQAILLFLGCVGFTIIILLLASVMHRRGLLFYAIPGADFVVFQVGSFVFEIYL